MTELSGTFEIDGKAIEWKRGPYGGTMLLHNRTGDALTIPGEPDIERARLALFAYEIGKRDGEYSGRCRLQHELRRLLGA